jgi:putative Holliday junction resolvase
MKVLGCDYGTRHMGLAASDPEGMIAFPLRTVHVDSDGEALDEICRACDETDAALVVVGLPLNMDGSRGAMAEKVEAIVAELRSRLPVKVVTWDERLSTEFAEKRLLEGGLSRRKRKRVRDRLAAQVILQGYLDNLARRRSLETGDLPAE